MKRTINSKGVITILAILFLVPLAFILLFLHISYDKTRMMEGETFCLTDTQPKQLLRDPVIVKKVYGYDADGNQINYIIGKDYIVDYSDGTIERTKDSNIPDYSAHKVVYNDEGKFIWRKTPDNPELNVSYLIYVDYTYKACIEEINPIDNKSDLLSVRTKDKILSGGNIKICLAGDSISVGCQTTVALYKGDNISNSFFGYLIETLESKYKCNIEPYLQSKAGMTRDYLLKNLDTIINNKPDVTIIAFGMNDHIGNSMYQEMLGSLTVE